MSISISLLKSEKEIDYWSNDRSCRAQHAEIHCIGG